MVDSFWQWLLTLGVAEKKQTEIIQIKMDNGPENSEVRTQLLNRMGGYWSLPMLSKTTKLEMLERLQIKVLTSLRVPKIWLPHFKKESSFYRYIFHHIGKCGGTSAVELFSNWFIIISDYPERNMLAQLKNTKPKNLEKLSDYHILCGHYGNFAEYIYPTLFQRYPCCLEDDRYRVISFVRDPLKLQISGYFYGIKNKMIVSSEKSLEQHLLNCDNFLAHSFACDESNYQEILDRYFFIGIFENYQQSFDRLATLLEKPKVQLKKRNVSKHTPYNLTDQVIGEFKEKNQLDYQIYNYCKKVYEEKFNDAN